MSTTTLTQQLSDLSDSLKASNTLITRLSKLTFQPGSEPLSEEEDSNTVRIELAQDIHSSLKEAEEEVELLKQEAEDIVTAAAGSGGGRRTRDSERDRDRARLDAQVARVEEDLRSARSRFRRAQLSAKKASEAAKQRERELIFASLSNPPPVSPEQQPPNNTSTSDLFAARRKGTSGSGQQQKHLTQSELELSASTTLTASLRRIHNHLTTELSRSRFAQETFDESSAALAELGEHYTSLGGILDKSKDLLGTLLRSQKSDTWYLETAFWLLIATLSWLVFRRILLGPFVRLPWFLLRWFVLKPSWLLLTLTGVITTTTSQPSASASSRTPLIIQPSAKSRLPHLPSHLHMSGTPAGAGGAQAKIGKEKDPAILEGEMSEAVGKMAEEFTKQTEPEGDKDPDAVIKKGEAVVAGSRRGDGTVLQERGDVERNPKKKVWDVGAEEGMGKQDDGGKGRDEL